jgi:[ribosomal protein S18]-alanine N-acetyltransferase
MHHRLVREPFSVRPMSTEDLEQTLDLRAEVAAERRYIGAEAPIDRAGDEARWRARLLDSDDGAMFVAVAGGRVIGNASLVGSGPAELGMTVARGWRRRGVGRALLEACLEWARHHRVHKISLQVWPDNDAAIHLYEGYGFEREGYLHKHYRRRSGELWDAVIMGLVLDPSPRPPEPEKSES